MAWMRIGKAKRVHVVNNAGRGDAYAICGIGGKISAPDRDYPKCKTCERKLMEARE